MHLTIMAKKSPKCSAIFFFVKSKNTLLVKNLKYATSLTIKRCAKGKTGTCCSRVKTQRISYLEDHLCSHSHFEVGLASLSRFQVIITEVSQRVYLQKAQIQ